jgi:hypothetical protein
MKDNNTNQEQAKTNGLAELLSALINHPDCDERIKDAILTTTVEIFENKVKSYSPEWFQQMLSGESIGKNINITINQR